MPASPIRGPRAASLVLAVLLAGCSGGSIPEPGAGGAPAEDWYRPAPGIEWREWGPEPFRQAAASNRPVLLHITARWAHLCHRMERITFTDPDVARLVNERYVPIRVDRDRHPEVDLRHQIGAGIALGAGGYPLTVFLTPEGDLIRAVGFLTPEDEAGRPGMRQVLQAVAGRYADRTDSIRRGAAARTALYRESMPVWRSGPLDGGLPNRTALAVREDFGPPAGGFGRLLAFPDDSRLRFARLWAHRTGDQALGRMVDRLLERLADSGLHDPVGGGFHRRAVDSTGRLPAFEKLLAPNAALLGAYLAAYQASGRERFRRVAEGIAGFLLDELADAERGGFFAARSAEVEPREYGTYYTWTQEEIRSASSADDAKVLLIHYDVGPVGEIESRPARNVLVPVIPAAQIAASLGLPEPEVEARLESGRAALRAARRGRAAPPLDRRIPADGNAAAISALLEAARVLGRDDARRAAIAAADRLLADHRPGGTLFSRFAAQDPKRVEYRLADQAEVAVALLAVYEETGGAAYLQAARAALEETLVRFRDPEGSALAALPVGVERPGLLADRRFPVLDPGESAANAVAAWALDRLSYLTKEKGFHAAAESILAAFAGNIGAHGSEASSYSIALEHHLRHPIRVVVIGAGSNERTTGLTRAAGLVFHPGKMILSLDPDRDAERIRQIGYPPGDRPLAYICTDRKCAPPVFEPDRVEPTMRAFAASAYADRPLTGPDPS